MCICLSADFPRKTDVDCPRYASTILLPVNVNVALTITTSIIYIQLSITHLTYLNIAQLLFPLEIFVSDLRSLFFGNFNRCSVVNFCIISFYYVYDIRV